MIETSRLLLRKPDPEDFDIISEIFSSPEQTKFLPNEAPYPMEKQQEYLANRIKHWALHNFGTFVVCLKANPSVKLGFVGAEFSPNPDCVDIRYGISKRFEGKGYITEAAKALLSWVFNNTEHTKVYGVSMPENLASIAIIKKLGMKVEENVDLYHCQDLKNYSETFARCHERRQDTAKTDEKAEFMPINEHFESVFNKVLASAVVVQKSHSIEATKIPQHP